ncbi:zinc finger protein 839 [Tachyglossus aculeatus]|uniref:zinc finger protein 839 n=1 Tax=Tachyglossus aculeatus TaxID=9261 RepID=UPI0018F64EB6|nr:zinc finger protein 839 [Tachyglossus aculeatus]
MPPLAAIQPKTITLNQPFHWNPNPSGLRVINPQILRIEPITGTGQQQYLLNSSANPSLQLLVQKPLPPLGPVSVKKITAPKFLNGQRIVLAPVSPAETPISPSVLSSSADSLVPNLKEKHTEKLKRSLKVKTRSGRISRPPKYKARDYKFIKTEDLADGHPSDSDDYSELSVEEEEDRRDRGKDALFSPPGCYLRPKAFKCQFCEKSYIGKGGLARHYKLNPSHGQLEALLPRVFPSDKPNGLLEQENSERMGVASQMPAKCPPISAVASIEGPHPGWATEPDPTPSGQQMSKSADVGLLSEPGQENGSHVTRGSGKSRGAKRRGRQSTRRKQRCSGFRPNSLSGTSAEQTVVKRKARLKELFQQCDDDDLMELALPRLTKLITVYEFLLMKVERHHSAKPFFADVYKEFEELHKMIKKMCQDHFSNSITSFQKPLEIINNEVAESLGITEELLRQQEAQMEGTSVHPAAEEGSAESGQQKRGNETPEETVAPVKRVRVDQRQTGGHVSHDGPTETSLQVYSPVAKEGFSQLHGSTPQSSEEPRGARLSDAGETMLQTTQQISVLADLEAQVGSPGPVAHDQTLELQEEIVPAHSPDPNASGRLAASDSSGVETSGGPVDLPKSDSSRSEEVRDGRESQEYCANCEHPDQGKEVNEAHQAQQLEKVLSMNLVPLDHPYRTLSEPQDAPGAEGPGLPQGNLDPADKTLNRLPCGIEERGGSIVAVDETVAFEIAAGESRELLPQEHERIFIQTSDGLLLSHPGTVVSQTDGIVIVTQADGTAMHIQTPGGVPLETVEALLAVEADNQGRGILISHGAMEPDS